MNNDKIEAVKGVSALSSTAFEQKVKAEVGLKVSEWKDKGVPLEKITYAATKMMENQGFNREQSEKIITEILGGYHFDGNIGSLKQVKASENSDFGQDSSGFSGGSNSLYQIDANKLKSDDFDTPVSISFTVGKMKSFGIDGKDTIDTLKKMDQEAKAGDEESKIGLQTWKNAIANTTKDDLAD